jgi:hypothetical protein
MATTTPNYGWTVPTSTDLVKDGATAIETLGDAVDATVYANANAAINKTIVDAKGDLIAATAADTVSRLAVGTDNQVLTADSSTATGLKWAAATATGAAGVYLSKPTAGSLYYAKNGATGAAGATANLGTADRTFYLPIMVSNITASRIGIYTHSSWAATAATMRLGIYNNNATLNIPTTVLLDAGTVAVSAASTLYEITISQALSPGLYWLAMKCAVVGTGSNIYSGNNIITNWTPMGLTNSSAANLLSQNQSLNCYFEDQATGTLKTVSSLTLSTVSITPNMAIGY